MASVHAAVCERPGSVQLSAADGTTPHVLPRYDHSTRRAVELSSTSRVRCEPLSTLLRESLGEAPRVDFLSLDVEGSEPAAIASMGRAASFGVVIVEIAAGRRRVAVMTAMLTRGFAYVGQISGRPTTSNYVMSDVFFNASFFASYWPGSPAATVLAKH